MLKPSLRIRVISSWGMFAVRVSVACGRDLNVNMWSECRVVVALVLCSVRGSMPGLSATARGVKLGLADLAVVGLWGGAPFRSKFTTLRTGVVALRPSRDLACGSLQQ